MDNLAEMDWISLVSAPGMILSVSVDAIRAAVQPSFNVLLPVLW